MEGTAQKTVPHNGNMVLQLVLPDVQENNKLEANNTDTQDTTYGDKFNINRDAGKSSTGKHDIYSCVPNADYINHGYSNDLAEFEQGLEMNSLSYTTTLRRSDLNAYKSTSLEEKNRIFRDYLTRILSCVYALFIVTLGLVVYVSDVIVGTSAIAETFSLYLVLIALLFILYLITDIILFYTYKNKCKNRKEDKNPRNVSLQLNISLPQAGKNEPMKHHYCLSKQRHSTNFYLKIGAAGFCLGHLIHSGLLLGYQIVFLTSDGDAFYDCGTIATLILDFIYPIYSFLLLYFIFKYSNIIINKRVAVSRFGIMHCISSSLCFWVWTIFRETIESLSNHGYDNDKLEDANRKKTPEVSFLSGDSQPLALPLTSYNKRGAKLLTAYLNTTVRHFRQLCEGDQGIGVVYQNYSPYLYPFSVEYSILVVGVLFVIWQSIGRCREEISESRQCDTSPGNGDNLESNIVIHADCHSANKGLFGGIVVIVITIVSIILFFIAINDVKMVELGILVNKVTSSVIILLMTATGILAYRQITKLDVNKCHISLLDDLLLFMCIPAFFLNGIFSIIPAILSGSVLSITFVILEVTQILVQTPLIIDGLRRCSNSRGLRREKPGRELLTFLIVCNVAMWITQTFQVKSHGLQDHRYDFYGKVLWTIIGHMCLPLIMFYRFHSSVCIVDIWKYAYEPEIDR